MRDTHLLPFVSLLLILCVVAVVLGAQPRGLWVRIPTWVDSCGDGDRIVVVQALPDGRVKLNVEELALRDLGPRLNEVFRRRAERVVFVTASNETPFELFVRACEVAKREADHIAFMTLPRDALHDSIHSWCYTLTFEGPMCVNSTKPIIEIKKVPLLPWD